MSADTIAENLNLVLKNTSTFIVMLDRNFAIIDANDKFEALVGIVADSFQTYFEKSEVGNTLTTCFSENSQPTFTTSISNKDGVRTWVEWSANAEGDRCLLVGQDVTAYHRSIEELHKQRESFEQKTKIEDLFVAKMNHELRTPLNAIIGYSQILLRAGLGESEVDHAQRIRYNGKKLLQQIDNVLAISETDPALEIEKVDLFPLLQSVIDEFAFSIGEADLSVAIEDRRLLAPVDADYSSLRHVIRNLLDNAIKFSNAGEIKLVVESQETKVIALHIVDEGVGVEDDKIDDIFAPFKKGALLMNDCGVGLGLSVAKKMCEKMGFVLNLLPCEVGSKFTINFESKE